MYIITDINIILLSVKSCYIQTQDRQEAFLNLLETISEHLYVNYFINCKGIREILSKDFYFIDEYFYMEKTKHEEDNIQIVLYKKTAKKGFLYTYYEEIPRSIFNLTTITDPQASVSTIEYVKLT